MREETTPSIADWVPREKILKKAGWDAFRVKMGLEVMVGQLLLEKRVDPITKLVEYRITPIGISKGLNWKNLD